MSTMRSTHEALQAELSGVAAESLRADTDSFHHKRMQPPLLIRYLHPLPRWGTPVPWAFFVVRRVSVKRFQLEFGRGETGSSTRFFGG